MTEKDKIIEEMCKLDPVLEPVSITASSLDDAWFQAIRKCVRKGYVFKIDQGSYAGQYRKQFFAVTIHITHPWTTPLSPTLPPGLGYMQPTTDEKIQTYFEQYLLNPDLEKNEEYKYATWIVPQLLLFLPRIKKEPYSNQYTITLGGLDTVELPDPPCLRQIDIKIIDGKVNFFVVFRSWDLFAGFPENMGGLQLLKKFVADETGLEDGTLTAFSSGLHIYDHFWELANVRIGKTL